MPKVSAEMKQCRFFSRLVVLIKYSPPCDRNLFRSLKMLILQLHRKDTGAGISMSQKNWGYQGWKRVTCQPQNYSQIQLSLFFPRVPSGDEGHEAQRNRIRRLRETMFYEPSLLTLSTAHMLGVLAGVTWGLAHSQVLMKNRQTPRIPICLL